MPKKLTYEKALEKTWASHPTDKNNYGYLNEYPGRHKPWKIYCYECNAWFTQNAGNHINGQGCRKCSYDKRRILFALGLLKFTEKANKIHNNIYDYSKGIYVNSLIKIEIICKKHGSFWQKPNDHLNEHGCPDCAKENQLKPQISLSKVLETANQIHNFKYGYSWIDMIGYRNKRNKVPIICPNHGIFYQSLETHCSGNGCPACANHGFDPTKSATLYYIKDIPTGLYKIGITNNSLERRFEGKFKKIKVIKTWHYDSGFDAREQEIKLHKEYTSDRLLNESWVTKRGSNGATEFFNKDVLGLDKQQKIKNKITKEITWHQ